MILNRTGAEFEYEGVTYTIGGAIVGTTESEYGHAARGQGAGGYLL